MTERVLPPEGAPACPFLALADDRDARFDHPDRSHRCYAESPPAPRATAHQITFCLGAAFASCPTFTDWARREVARVKPPESWRTAGDAARPAQDAGSSSGAPIPPVTPPGSPPGRAAATSPGRASDQRRDWAAPPPWLTEPGGGTAAGVTAAGAAAAGASAAGASSEGPVIDDRADAGGRDAGPSGEGSASQRRATPGGPLPPPGTATTRPADDPGPQAAATPAFLAGRSRPAIPPPDQEVRRPGSAASRPRPSSRQRSVDRGAPAWEEPRRYEAYPTIRTRVGMPRLSPLLLGVVAVAVAAAALFFLPPMFLGLGGGGDASPTPAPTASAEPTVPASPTPTPAPTPTVYIVKAGDTLSKIAASFGLTVEDLLAVNPQITDPNSIQIGDQIVIPQPEPSEIVDTSGEESTPVP